MSTKDGRTTSSSPAPARSGGMSSPRPLMMKRLLSTGKPKRSFFPCAACGKTFPTQQAMAGHSSTHGHSPPLPVDPVHESRAGGQRRVPGVAAGRYQYHGRGPAVAVPRLCYLPLVPRHHHMINHQLPRWAPPCVQQLLGLHTPPPHQMADVTHTAAVAFLQTAAHQIQATLLGWGPLFPHHTLLQMASSVPVQSHASSTTNQQHVQVDLTLQLGLGRRVVRDAGGGKKAAVMMDAGDRGGKDLDGLDLELRLCC